MRIQAGYIVAYRIAIEKIGLDTPQQRTQLIKYLTNTYNDPIIASGFFVNAGRSSLWIVTPWLAARLSASMPQPGIATWTSYIDLRLSTRK